MPIISERAYSISPEALIENTSYIIESSSSTDSIVADNRIITLIANESISANELVGIVNQRAVKADYASIRAMGVAITNGVIDGNIQVQISGTMNINNNIANEYFLGNNGNIRIYSYEVGKYLQRVAIKLTDTQILLDFSDFILME